MNVRIAFALAGSMALSASFAQKPFWLDETVNEENRLPMHASYFVFENKALAEKGDWQQSSNYQSLNGNWNFKWVEKPADLPANFESLSFDDSKWATLKVPANWELNGYGYPIYVNIGYEFQHYQKANPPEVPLDYDPTAVYRRTITLSPSWKGKQVLLHLGAVKSNVSVWINGKYVGYGEDSKLPQEFDATPFLKPGSNTIVLKIMRWSDGTYLEGQDFWRLAGITRDCYLVARNPVHIFDYNTRTVLNEDFSSATLKTNINLNQPATATAQVQLFYKGALIKEKSTTINNQKNGVIDIVVNKPNLWSSESPNLYKAFIALKDKTGKILEIIPQRVGFRKVEMKDGLLHVNGKAILVKGVNRHETDMLTGQVISKESMLRDVKLMKQYNINANRCSHYPNDEYWYQLCDEYGIFVVDEANIESHGIGYDKNKTLANKPTWHTAHMQRTQRMYERDKNEPCVIIWSLGNEAGNGTNFYDTYNWLKQIDSTRPVQFEQAVKNYKLETEFNTDIADPMYASPQDILKYAVDNPHPQKPVIQCEYAHAMGNSLGNFKDYWDVIRANRHALQGGFIWDFVDQGFEKVTAAGDTIYTYGGDYGPANVPTDNNFNCNGIFFPNRKPNPHAFEMKNVYQDIHTSLADKNRISIYNERFFTDLSDVKLVWQAVVNGEIKASGIIDNVNVRPQETKEFTIPYPVIKDGEVFLNIYYKQKKAEGLIPKDYTVAWEQLALGGKYISQYAEKAPGEIKVKESNNDYDISSSKLTAHFNKQNGFLDKLTVNGVELIEKGTSVRPSFWRAPTDNDMGASLQLTLKAWKKAQENLSLKNFTVDAQSNIVVVNSTYDLPDVNATLTIQYRIHSSGELNVQQQLLAGEGKKVAMLPRFGIKWILPQGFDNLSYYGRGPWENYSDRNYSSIVGLYKQTVKEQYYGYVRPQENGNKTDVRWLQLQNKNGKSVQIISDSLLSISALHYLDEDLDDGDKKDQRHSGELKARPITQLHIDLKQMGLGGINSWGTLPLEQYRIPYKNYSYSFSIIPK